MADVTISRAELKSGKTWPVRTGAAQRFVLRDHALTAVELEDLNFHHASAVIMPDYGVTETGEVDDTENDASGTADQIELAGLKVVAAVLKFARSHPDAKLLLAGHTDTTGDAAFNLKLSRLRARSARAVLVGDRADWIEVCKAQSKVEDYQQILRWIAAVWKWPCDPGKVDNVNDAATQKAVKAFQTHYRDHWEDDSKKDPSLGADGDVGPKTWGAFFDVYQDVLEQLMGLDREDQLQEYRDAVKWLDPAHAVIGCGEHQPIDAAEKDNFKSETNRRVEFLFFDPGEEPVVPLACHPSETKCVPGDCPIYWKYDRSHLPVDPAFISKSAYRITLRLGDVENLFPTEPNTPQGRMARLQTVGLFYFPLAHAQALNALNGLPATPANAATGHPGDQAFAGSWSYFKSDIIDGKTAAAPATDPEADADLQSRLKSFIVDGGTLPEPVAAGATPDAAKNFRKLRIPGGFTFVDAIGGSGLNTNRDPAYPMDMTGDQFAVEDLFHRDNPVLGKVPLVVKVEAKKKSTGEFQPVAGVTVHFQLVPVDPLPAYDATQPANAQIMRPPLRESNMGGPADPAFASNPANPGVLDVPAEPGIPNTANGLGPRLRYTIEEARNPDATDPQGTNCHRDRGGKRGTGNVADGSNVANVIFETTSRAGFNVAHGGRALPHKPYPLAEAVTPDGDKHRHAVKAKSNEDGEAGVIFTPSRMGGDTYRLRVYLGPPLLPSDGTEADAVKAETGTFVVWRSIRLSRYYQVVPLNPDPALLAEVNNAATYNITSNNAYLSRVGAQLAPPLNDGNWNPVEGSPPPNFSGAIVMWARAWCEFQIDRNALSGGSPLSLTAAEYSAARRQALADGIANQAAAGTSYNLPNLLYLEAGAPALTPGSGVCCVPIRTPEAYNAMPGTTAAQRIPIRTNAAGATLFGATAAHQNLIDNLHLNFLLPGFSRSLSMNGYRPGFTVIQSAMGCTWQLIGQNGDFSGIAINYRAGHLWYGRDVYLTVVTPAPANFSYGYDSNMIHEMGHCHFREHGPGRNPGRRLAGGADPAKHDVITTSICVMSYKNCEGDLCGMCTIGLRGWDIRPMTP